MTNEFINCLVYNPAMENVAVPGYKPAQQERSSVAQFKIIETMQNFLESGRAYNDLTNNEIAEAAGVKVQSLYQWFEKGKETIAAVLVAQFQAEMLIRTPYNTADTRESIRAIFASVRGLAENHRWMIYLLLSNDLPRYITRPQNSFVRTLAADMLAEKGHDPYSLGYAAKIALIDETAWAGFSVAFLISGTRLTVLPQAIDEAVDMLTCYIDNLRVEEKVKKTTWN